MILSDKDIRKYYQNSDNTLIDPFNSADLKSASYDLTAGNKYYSYSGRSRKKRFLGKSRGGSQKSKDENMIELKQGDKIKIAPRGSAIVISQEKLIMPEDLCATVSLALSLVKKGLIMAVQPPIDPGYEGKIIALLHNMSDENIEIDFGKHILTLIFYKLSSNPESTYEGRYRDITLEQFCDDSLKQAALVNLTEEAKRACADAQDAAKKSNAFMIKSLTFILGLVTLIVTVLKIYITILSGGISH